MVTKVEAEGKKEQALFDKYMCYCKSSGGELADSIDAANTKTPELEAAIEAAESKRSQIEKDVKELQADRAAGKKALREADELREKGKAEFEGAKVELEANLEAVGRAVQAVEAGATGGFLQTPAAGRLRASLQARGPGLDADRRELLAFLSGEQESDDEEPQSGEILGIMKQLHEEIAADLKEATANEATAVKEHAEIVAAKKKDVQVSGQMIEEKLGRAADLGVKIEQLKADLDDTQSELAENKQFVAELEKGCKTKEAEWEERKKVRSEEHLALTDTIKMLNDDDALELFKKTLPSASASFLQVQVGAASLRARALATLGQLRHRGSRHRAQLDFIALALRGRAGGFEKVIKFMDDLVATLKKEQQDDDNKKEYCGAQFDQTDDQKKSLEQGVADLETVMADAKESIATAAQEVAALEASIRALDKSVAEATAQRQEESEECKDLVAGNTAAREILAVAKNRLNKFYNPKLYKKEAGLLEEGAAGEAGARGAPPPPPETFGAYSKKSGESSGVIAMIDLLVRDLEKEMTEAKAAEKLAQADYEELMADAQAKRAEDAKSLEDKVEASADLQGTLEESQGQHTEKTTELQAMLKYIHALHGECDWLLKYFDVRQKARTEEIDALGKAKAVLNGADYSFF